MNGVIKANTFENELRNKLIKLALLQQHKLYVHGSHGPDTFDCAGLVWFLYHELFEINLYDQGFGLSTTTRIMTSLHGIITLYAEDDLNKDLSVIRNGDILFFHRQSMSDTEPKVDNKYPGHCGIYLGDNNFIHCSRPKGEVIISNFDKNEYWKKVLVASKNILSDNKILERVKR